MMAGNGAELDSDLAKLASDLRDANKGSYDSMPAGAEGIRLLRMITYASRRKYIGASGVGGAPPPPPPPPPPEDESKDLPSDNIDAMRAQLRFLLCGLECPRAMRLSPTIMSRMSRAAKKGSFYVPYVAHMRFAQTGGDRVAAVIAKAVGVTVEARFDDMPAADLPEVRLVADFLHLAWCRAYEAAAALIQPSMRQLH